MALFSKPPAKKPQPPKAEAKVRRVAPGERAPSARDVLSEAAARRAPASTAPSAPASRPPASSPAEGTTANNAKVVELAKAKPAIEIEYSSAMCAAVENAALMFASAQAKPARQTLEEAIVNDAEAKSSSLAWLCLFDLLRRANDKGSFDRIALQYVVEFERSAPGWEELGGPVGGARITGAGGTIAVSGPLSAMSALQFDALKRVGHGDATQVKLDLGAVDGFDDEGAKALAQRLAELRRRGAPLEIARSEKLRSSLETALNGGREAGQGAWVLLLELLQWAGEQAAFDDRAVEYAVTFEMSPPSWEPPAPQRSLAAHAKPKARAGDAELLAWSEAITGANPPQVAELLEFAQARSNVVLDMSTVDRIDFASAGALVNAIHRLAQQHKTLQVAGATPIVRALLLLVGVPGELFIRKPA